MQREKDLERKAEEIADGAVAGYDKLFPPHIIAEMRRLVILDLLGTKHGRAQLRACLEDPFVIESEEVGDEAPPTEKMGDGTGGR